jgi:hypothetical protein
LIWSISNPFFDSRVKQSGSKTILIAMPSTHAERMARSHDSWARRPTLVDGLSQSHVVKLSCCADIAHSSEASHQRGARMLDAENCCKRFEVPKWSVLTCRITQHTSDQVSMCIDKAGHESYIAKIDHFGIRGNVHSSRRAHGGDRVVSHNDNGVIDRGGARTVDQSSSFQNNYALPDRSLWRDLRHDHQTH